MRRQPDVQRQHPEALQERQDALLGRQRQGDDEHVDAGAPGEFHQLADIAELGVAGDDGRRTPVVAVVEDAADADVAVGLALEAADQAFGAAATADDDGAPLHAAVTQPAADLGGQRQAPDRQEHQAADEPAAHPEPRIGCVVEQEEQADREEAERQAPGDGDPPELGGPTLQDRDLVAVGQIDREDAERRADQRQDDVGFPKMRGNADIADEESQPYQRQQHELDAAPDARQHPRRDEIVLVLGCRPRREGVQLDRRIGLGEADDRHVVQRQAGFDLRHVWSTPIPPAVRAATARSAADTPTSVGRA